MAIRTKKSARGFALLVALIFMSVLLTFGLTLSSLAYKQQILASSAIGSQHAFYAADAALECALYADQQMNLFPYPASAPNSAPGIPCGGGTTDSRSTCYNSGDCLGYWVTTHTFSLDSNSRCADVTLYKPSRAGVTSIYSRGYDVPCSRIVDPQTARFTVRGIQTFYNSTPY